MQLKDSSQEFRENSSPLHMIWFNYRTCEYQHWVNDRNPSVSSSRLWVVMINVITYNITIKTQKFSRSCSCFAIWFFCCIIRNPIFLPRTTQFILQPMHFNQPTKDAPKFLDPCDALRITSLVSITWNSVWHNSREVFKLEFLWLNLLMKGIIY